MARYALLVLLLLVQSGARAQDVVPPVIPAPAESAAQSPRVVVVVRGGDPTPEVLAAASALEAQLAAAGLTLPSDEGMRTVLRGGVPASPEGYEPARAARLRLGWSPEADREALAGIGRFVEADAVVVVTRAADAITVEVFDPGANDFYEGSTTIIADDPSPAVPFVRTRARAALRRRIEPAAVARAETQTTPSSGATTQGDAAPTTPAEEPRWIKRNWPILLATALLGGTVSYFVVSRRRDDHSDPPVIHIHPGGN